MDLKEEWVEKVEWAEEKCIEFLLLFRKNILIRLKCMAQHAIDKSPIEWLRRSKEGFLRQVTPQKSSKIIRTIP